jgi:hypothetical protein
MRLLTQQDIVGEPPTPAPPTATDSDDAASITSFILIPVGIIVCLAVFAWVAFKINSVEPGACWSLIKFWKWSDFERQAQARVEEQRFKEYQQLLSTKGVPVVVVMPDTTEVCCAIKDTASTPMNQCMINCNSNDNNNEDEQYGEDAASPSSSSSTSDRGATSPPSAALSSTSIKVLMKRYGFPAQFFVADVETHNDNYNNDNSNKEASHHDDDEEGAPPSLVAHFSDSAASLRRI